MSILGKVNIRSIWLVLPSMMLVFYLSNGYAYANHKKPNGLSFDCDRASHGAILHVHDTEWPMVDEKERPILDRTTGKQKIKVLGFTVGDGFLFKEALKDCIKRYQAIHRIDFTSGGGQVAAAVEIVKVIAAHGFHTHVPKGSRCISACTLAFLGGFRRTVDPKGSYEVHSGSRFSSGGEFSFAEDVLNLMTRVSKEPDQKMIAQIMIQTLAQMGQAAGKKKITEEQVKILIVATRESLNTLQKSLALLKKNPIAYDYLLNELGKHFRAELTEIERSAGMSIREWMQIAEERRVSRKLMDHVLTTTILGLRPLTREELKDLTVITDEAPVTD